MRSYWEITLNYRAMVELVELENQYAGASEIKAIDAKRRRDLQVQLLRIASANPGPQITRMPEAIKAIVERRSSPPQHQKVVGLNGPADRNLTIFSTRESADASWVRNAISSHDFDRLMDGLDFETEHVIAVSFGATKDATGEVLLDSIETNEAKKSIFLRASIELVK